MVSEFDGICDGHSTRLFVEDAVAAIVVKCWSNVEPFMTAIIPRALCSCFAVDKDATPCQWSGIKVERPKEVFPS